MNYSLKSISIITSTILCLMFNNCVHATPLDNPLGGYLNSGEFMFLNIGSNDPWGTNADYTALEEQIEDWFLAQKRVTRDIDLSGYVKWDADTNSYVTSGDQPTTNMTITFETDLKSGTWSTELPIEFYIVKGRNDYAMYWVEGLDNFGSWATDGLIAKNNKFPTISHLSSLNPGTSQVPEPTTMLIFGTGLVGLAGVLRKKRK